MKKKEFDKLPIQGKWNLCKRIKDVKWHCENCGNIVDKGAVPKRSSEGSIHCGSCDYLLTHRTPGSQSDPFYWTFKENKKPLYLYIPPWRAMQLISQESSGKEKYHKSLTIEYKNKPFNRWYKVRKDFLFRIDEKFRVKIV